MLFGSGLRLPDRWDRQATADLTPAGVGGGSPGGCAEPGASRITRGGNQGRSPGVGTGMTLRRTLLSLITAVVVLAGSCSSDDPSEVITGGDDPAPTSPVDDPTPNPDPAPTPDDDAGSDDGDEPPDTGSDDGDEPSSPDEPAGDGDVVALTALADARARWSANGFSAYAYTWTRFCECSEEASGPVRVTVDGGRVVRATWFGTSTSGDRWTAEQLFDMIEASIERGEQVSVTYDAVHGFPSEVRLDLESIPVDGGLDLLIDGFVAFDLLRAELDAARARWEAAAITDYQLTYREVCFCPENTTVASIRGGVVVDRTVAGDVFGPDRIYTVDALFDAIGKAIDDGVFGLTAAYDQELGYPTEFFVDVEQMIADEEFGVSVVDLSPV